MIRFRNGVILVVLSAVIFVLNPVRTPAQPKKLVDPPATDPATMKVAKGFKVELIYSVPKETQGSWVNMTPDPKGRLIVSDQNGSLYRVTLRGAETPIVEPIPIAIGEAQGLLFVEALRDDGLEVADAAVHACGNLCQELGCQSVGAG